MTIDEIKEKIDNALRIENPSERAMLLSDVKGDLEVYKSERDGTELEKDGRIAELENDVAIRDERIHDLEDSNRRICEKYTAQIIDEPKEIEQIEQVEPFGDLIMKFDTV